MYGHLWIEGPQQCSHFPISGLMPCLPATCCHGYWSRLDLGLWCSWKSRLLVWWSSSSEDLVSGFRDQTVHQCLWKCHPWPMDCVSLSSFKKFSSLKKLPKDTVCIMMHLRCFLRRQVCTWDVQQPPPCWSSAFIFLSRCVAVVL